MVQKWLVELPAKTGRSLDDWLHLIEQEGPATESERRAWLKAQHGLGTNGASWLAERSVGKGAEDSDPELYLQAAERYVDEMFAGGRAGLRPVYDELLKRGLGLAKDVKACPGKTIVPLYRNHVFAQIKPATRTRIDLGFALQDTRATGRLIDTGGRAKGDRITHRIPIGTLDDIDAEVMAWLHKAYELDG
jgi:hypothetical protein